MKTIRLYVHLIIIKKRTIINIQLITFTLPEICFACCCTCTDIVLVVAIEVDVVIVVRPLPDISTILPGENDKDRPN
jgi:hypothetical protein